MLNPKLYTALKAVCPEGVRITNEDEPLVFGQRLGPDGKFKKWKEQSGEQYYVCCPICGDERFRLSISYAWGLDTKQKYPTSKLVNCFNERCQEKHEEGAIGGGNVLRWLEQHLRSSYLRAIKSGAVTISPIIRERKREDMIPFPKPEWCQSLAQLPEKHPAIKYIRERKFDPAELATVWGVVYANQYPVRANNKDYSWLAGRLFIPTVGEGWQARAADEVNKPKYFSCPGWKKSEGLYSQQRARAFTYVMLCEGVTDVWRVDGPAVAIFGKTLANEQVMKIKRNWDTVGVLLDPDTEDDSVNSMRRAMSQLSHAGLKVFRVTLPGVKDAGSCTYKKLWDCIEQSAATNKFIEVRRPHA